MADAVNITRRSIFKLAPAAVLAAGGAVAAFPTQFLTFEVSKPESLREEAERLFGMLSDGQERNVLDFLRRAVAAAKEN